MKNGVQSVKSFEAQVHKSVRKIFSKLVDHEARKILDAGVIRTKSAKKSKPKIAGVIEDPMTLTQADVEAVLQIESSKTPYADALATHGTKIKAAKAMGLAETTFRDRLNIEIARAS